jgi:hypothetical protein
MALRNGKTNGIDRDKIETKSSTEREVSQGISKFALMQQKVVPHDPVLAVNRLLERIARR